MNRGVAGGPLFAGAVVLLSVSLCSPAAQGGLVYTLIAEGSGRLGNSPFHSSRITISLTAEPGSVTRVDDDVVIAVGPATVTVAGVGSAQFVNTSRVFATDFGDVGAVGFGRGVDDTDVLDVKGPGLAGYTLTVPFGPFTANKPDYQNFDDLETTAGPLNVTISGPVTFRASGTPTAIPLPAAAWASLGAVGLFAANHIRRRR
jgi:hypothetical protein